MFYYIPTRSYFRLSNSVLNLQQHYFIHEYKQIYTINSYYVIVLIDEAPVTKFEGDIFAIDTNVSDVTLLTTSTCPTCPVCPICPTCTPPSTPPLTIPPQTTTGKIIS